MAPNSRSSSSSNNVSRIDSSKKRENGEPNSRVNSARRSISKSDQQISINEVSVTPKCSFSYHLSREPSMSSIRTETNCIYPPETATEDSSNNECPDSLLWTLCVETHTGETLYAHMLPSDTVYDVKQDIFTDYSIPIASQILIHNGRVLKDSWSLIEAGLYPLVVVKLVLKMQDGPWSATQQSPSDRISSSSESCVVLVKRDGDYYLFELAMVMGSWQIQRVKCLSTPLLNIIRQVKGDEWMSSLCGETDIMDKLPEEETLPSPRILPRINTIEKSTEPRKEKINTELPSKTSLPKIGSTSNSFSRPKRPITGKSLSLPPISNKSIYTKESSENKEKQHCNQCRKVLRFTSTYKCKCGNVFCNIHRFNDKHQCTFDYKREGKEKLLKENPTVRHQWFIA